MSWTLALQLGLLAPVVAALAALALANTTGERGFPSLVCGAGAGLIAAGAIAAVAGEDTAWRGFDVTAWSGLLAAGILLCAAAVSVRTGSVAKRAALLMAAAAASASVLSPDRLWFGVLMATTTIAHGVALAADGPQSRTRARSLAIDAFSAGLILLGFALSADESLSFEDVDGYAGALVLAGGLLRLGVFGTPSDAAWPVALRAQGAFVCAFAGLGEAGLVAPAVAGLFLGTLRLWARPAAGSVEAVHCALIALGLGIGGSVATIGAAMLLAATFAATAVRLTGAMTFARPLLSFAPAGGAFLGVAMIAGAAGRLGAARGEWLFAAVPAVVAACVAAAAAWRMESDDGEPAPRLAAIAVVPALVVLGVLAFTPAFAMDRGAGPLAAAAGSASGLTIAPEVLTETAGLAVGAMALLGLLAGGVGAFKVSEREAPPIPPRLDVAEAEHPGLWRLAARVTGTAMLGFAVWLTLAAGNRGWL